MGLPPKLQKDKPVHNWLESFELYLSNKIGELNAPLTYVLRTDDAVAIDMLLHAQGVPLSDIHDSIKEELSIIAIILILTSNWAHCTLLYG